MLSTPYGEDQATIITNLNYYLEQAKRSHPDQYDSSYKLDTAGICQLLCYFGVHLTTSQQIQPLPAHESALTAYKNILALSQWEISLIATLDHDQLTRALHQDESLYEELEALAANAEDLIARQKYLHLKHVANLAPQRIRGLMQQKIFFDTMISNVRIFTAKNPLTIYPARDVILILNLFAVPYVGEFVREGTQIGLLTKVNMQQMLEAMPTNSLCFVGSC